jgi:hypothetical protein
MIFVNGEADARFDQSISSPVSWPASLDFSPLSSAVINQHDRADPR